MWYRIARMLLKWYLNICFKLEMHGEENFPEAPFLMTSNHSSLLDPPIAGVACRKYEVDFMAKKEMFDAPIIGAWTRSVGCIEVNRGANSTKSLKEAIRHLKNGRVVGMFPEGTRSEDGAFQEAKRGTGFLMAKAGVPVVPLYIEGTAEALPKGKGMKWGAKISVYIGKPITPEEFIVYNDKGKVDYDGISSLVMDKIAAIKNNI